MFNESSRETFKLKLEYMEPMDPSEPNDKPDQAKVIKPGEETKVAFYPTGDSDYFKLPSGEGETLRIKTKGKKDVSPEVLLYTRDKMDKLKGKSDWEELPVEFSVESGQSYILRLHDQHHNDSSPKPFELRVVRE